MEDARGVSRNPERAIGLQKEFRHNGHAAPFLGVTLIRDAILPHQALHEQRSILVASDTSISPKADLKAGVVDFSKRRTL